MKKKELGRTAIGSMADRQMEVIRLICNGSTVKEIADSLHISPRTVASIKNDILKFLHVRNTVELVRVVQSLMFFGEEEIGGIHDYQD